MQGFILILCLVTWSDNQRQCQENDLNMFLMVCTHTDTPEGERERDFLTKLQTHTKITD